MNEGHNESGEDISGRQEDLNFVRKFWTDTGEMRAKKFTDETSIPHTVADGLQEIAEHYNDLLDHAESSGTEDGERMANVIRGNARPTSKTTEEQ